MFEQSIGQHSFATNEGCVPIYPVSRPFLFMLLISIFDQAASIVSEAQKRAG